jgi:hypothetical protein
MDKQINREKRNFDAKFDYRNKEIPTICDHNSIVLAHQQNDKKLIELKKLLLIMSIVALTLAIILILMRIQSIDNFSSNKSPEKLIDGNHNFDTDESEVYKVLNMRNNSVETNYNKVVEISEAVKTPTTLAPTTTEETVKPSTTTIQSTTTKEIDYILATVTVNRATVPDKDYTIFSKVSDPFVDLYIDGIKIGSTNFIKDSNSPQWNYHFVHQIKLSVDSVISFEIFDKDLTKNEYIGGLTVKISQLMADGLNGKITHQNYGSGSLWFTVSWTEVYKSY